MNPAQYTLDEIEMAYDAGYKVGLAKGGEDLWIGRTEQDIRAAERDKIAAWLRGMDDSTATTLANWIKEGMDNL